MKAEMAIIRIVNTHGEDDDCTPTFQAMAVEASEASRTALLEIAKDVGAEIDELLPEQRTAMAALVRAVGGDASVFEG